jgi:hypothetical protein
VHPGYPPETRIGYPEERISNEANLIRKPKFAWAGAEATDYGYRIPVGTEQKHLSVVAIQDCDQATRTDGSTQRGASKKLTAGHYQFRQHCLTDRSGGEHFAVAAVQTTPQAKDRHQCPNR